MELKELFEKFAQSGSVTAIYVRPKRLEPVQKCSAVQAIENKGLEGDRYKGGGNRQVTLIQYEHLNVIASCLGRDFIDAALTRRNIVVKGINLLSLKSKQFQIGEAIFKYSGECHPCSRMEEIFGTGGYNAMRGHGGITAKVIRSGLIQEGDAVKVL